MGAVVNAFTGKSSEKAQAQAPVNTYKGTYSPLADDERKKYADKILAAQSGNAPSAADAFVKQAQDKALAQSMAIANSSRGNVNPAMLQRMAMRNAAEGQQAAIQQGAQAKAQESLGLMNMYEQLGLQADLANQQNKTQIQGINAGVSAGNQNTAAGFGIQGMKSGSDIIGGTLGAAGAGAGAAAASDENLKKDVKSGNEGISEFLDALKAHKYQYKDNKFGEGEFISPMAQELEKTPVGDSMVQDTPEGKMVDYGKGFGAVLAAQAYLNERLKKLEKKNG